MKIIVPALVLTLTNLLVSCNLLILKWEEPQTELEKLPAISTVGKNSIGCLVNGKALHNQLQMGITAIYQQGTLQIGADLENGNFDQSFIIFLNDHLEVGKSYSLANRSMFSNGAIPDTCYYEFSDTFHGSLTLSKIDTSKFIISGTFHFSTASEMCDTIHITNGRFDVQYTP